MILLGPGGAILPIRPASDALQSTAQANIQAPGPVSGSVGDAASAVRAETAQAVDPAAQSVAADAAAREEAARRARTALGIVEPARPSARMLASALPTEETPAGPPPTFDLSILEKARALDSAPPPLIEALPLADDASEADARGEIERPAPRDDTGSAPYGRDAPDAVRLDRPVARTEANAPGDET